MASGVHPAVTWSWDGRSKRWAYENRSLAFVGPMGGSILLAAS